MNKHAIETTAPLDDALRLRLVGELALPGESSEQHNDLAHSQAALRATRAGLLQAKEALNDLVENATVAMHWIGPDGLILWANSAEMKLLGYAREEYLGRHIADFHADPLVIADILRTLAGGRTLNEFPARLRHKDGSIRHVLINSNVLWEDGRFIHTRCFTQDITERVRVEEALREREAQLEAELADTRLLQEISAQVAHESNIDALYEKLVAAAVGIMRSDFASMQMFYPERGQKGELRLLAFHGFDPQAAKFWEWVRADSGCTCGQVLRTGQRAIAANVEQCDFMAGTDDLAAYLKAGMRAAQTTPLLSRSNKLVGMISTHWREPHQPSERDLRLLDILARQAADLIERKQAERLLRQRTAQYETLLDNAPLGVFVVGGDFRIRQVNPIALPVFGDIPDLIGRNFGEVIHRLFHTAFADEVARIFHRTLETGEPYIELERAEQRLDRGVIEYYEWRVNRIPLPEGGHGVVCYFSDISAQVNARAVIAESEERYRKLVSVITDVAWTTDASGCFVSPQVTWQAYTGQLWEEHRNLGWLTAFHADDREEIKTRWQRACDMPSTYEAHGRLWHRQSREYRYIVIRATPLLSATGTVREWVGSCTDIHNQREAENALRDADRRKDEFLAMLAHELRNPLAPIVNAVQLLHRSKTADAIQLQARSIIDRQAARLTRMVDDLLEVSRITSGRIQLHMEHITFDGLVERAVETARPLIEHHRHSLHVSLPREPVWLYGDMARLEQVVVNLLNNAAKYTNNGGAIALAVTVAGEQALLKVSDTGLGIEPEILPRIFDLFTQAERSLDRSRGGLGIGLSLVKRLVAMHGGTVTVESVVGKGSTFCVALPLSVSASLRPTVQPASNESPSVTGSLRVLIVDDNIDAAQSLGFLLGTAGHVVRLAHDGKAALTAAQEHEPELIFLDIGLPELDGYEVARRLRQHPARKGAILVAVTGYGQASDLQRARNAGFDHHLVKPAQFSAVTEILVSFAKARAERSSFVGRASALGLDR